MAEEGDHERSAVIWNAKAIDGLLSKASLFALAATGIRVTGVNLFALETKDVASILKWATPILIILTIAHLFLALAMRQSLSKFELSHSDYDRNDCFREIVANTGLWLRGMEKRVLVRRAGVPIHMMARTDLTSWLSYAAAVLLLVATFPDYRGMTDLQYLVRVALAICLVFANWLIGCIWAIGISQLGQEKKG